MDMKRWIASSALCALVGLVAGCGSFAGPGDEVIAGRMQRAAAEISHWAEYDYVLINEDMDQCLDEVRSILAAERLKRWRQAGLVSFVRDLVASSQQA
jgi:guanylate kinase